MTATLFALLLQISLDPAGVRIAAGLLFVSVPLYFLPSIIGWKKQNRSAILALNFFLGWTLIGWVVALVWALTVERPAPAA